MSDKDKKKQCWRENPIWRFGILFISIFLGLGFYLLVKPTLAKFGIDPPLLQTPATIPTLAFLWYFRTYDTRQQIAKADTQIEKSDIQIQQGNFVSGLNNLVSDDPMKIDIGTRILIDVSGRTNEFDEQIRLAFIKRLYYLPAGVKPSLLDYQYRKLSNSFSISKLRFDKGNCISIMEDERISYVKHILRWIYRHPTLKKNFTLRNIDFYYLEFAYNDTSQGFHVTDSDKQAYTVSIDEDRIERSLGIFATNRIID